MKPIQVTGKRKRAVERATLRSGKGIIRINQFNLKLYKPDMARMRIEEPLAIIGDIASKIDIDVHVNGGGTHGQTEAVRLVIGKALAEYDKKLKKPLLNYDRHLLVADVRRKEQRKPNDSKARKARQKSYR